MDKLDTLDSVFYNRILRIPDYQRGYAWGVKQLQEFWDDITNLPENKKHYTGMISIKKLDESEIANWEEEAWAIKNYEPHHIVDGQQRITTFVIFLNCILNEVRKLEKNIGKDDYQIIFAKQRLSQIVERYIVQVNPEYEKEKIYKFGYEIDNPSFNYLRKEIFGENLNKEIEHSFYTHNLDEAKRFFYDKLAAIKNESKDSYEDNLQKLYNRLTSDLLFVVQEISGSFDVNVAFETMNNRGLSLSNLEKLKNRLIYLITLYNEDELPKTRYNNIRNKINDSWKEIYKQLGRNSKFVLPDDDFLQNHWRVYHHYSRSSEHDYVTEILGETFTLKSVISKKENRLKPIDIEKYVEDLSFMSKYWYYTYNPYDWKEISKVEQNLIAKLNRLEMAYFRPIIACAYMNPNCDKDERIALLEAIERFVFILFRCKTGFTSQFKMSEYIGLAKELKNNKVSINLLIDRINGTTDYYSSNMMTFGERIDKLFSGSGDGFYSWEGIKYFLYEYETNLVEKYGDPKITAETFFKKNDKDRYSVEHVFPQTNSSVYYWANSYRYFDDVEKKALCGSLGNLLPLSASVNSTMQNYEYITKKNGQDEKRRGYKNGSYSELEVYNHNDCSNDWTYNDIKERGLRLLDFFEKRWNVVLGTEEEKIKLLHLDFLENIDLNIPELKVFENKYEVAKQSGTKVLRTKFWKELNNNLIEMNYKNSFSDSSLPTGNQLWFPKIGNTKVQMFIDIQNKITFRLHFGRKELFEAIKQNKQDIDEIFETNSKWDITNALSYRTLELLVKDYNYKDKDKWDEIIEWLSEKIIEVEEYFEEQLAPYDNESPKKESIRFTEEEFLNRKKSNTEEMKRLFNICKNKVLEIYPDTSVHYTQHYAAFVTTKAYMDIHIMRDSLEIHIKDAGLKSNYGQVLPPEYLWSLNFRLYIHNELELEEIIPLIKASYEIVK